MKKIWVLFGIILAAIALSLFFYWGNHSIVTTHHHYEHIDIPESFDGYTIVQVSDLHNANFDGQLTESVEEEDPDLIAVTGDVIDRNRTDIPVATQFLQRMTEIAPVYFVSGNHEIASEKYEELQSELDDLGIQNLDDSFTLLERNGEEIGLIGLADPLLIQEDDLDEMGTSDQVIQSRLEELTTEVDPDFTILLSHRPERFDIYAETDVDLAFTGHAHGGQIRLPWIGGLFAPTQGFLPQYSEGMHEENGTSMIVSRGLGNSIFPFRIFNRPELVVVTLEAN